MRGVKLAHYGACSNTTGVKLLMMDIIVMRMIRIIIIADVKSKLTSLMIPSPPYEG